MFKTLKYIHISRLNFQILLLLLISIMVFTPSVSVKAQSGGQDLSQVQIDVADALMKSRLAMRDLAECNLFMLSRIARILASEKANLIAYQGFLTSEVARLTANLNAIFESIEQFLPQDVDGTKTALEVFKTGLNVAGVLGPTPIGIAAAAGGVAIEATELYATWKNADLAEQIGADMHRRVEQQLENLAEAQQLYQEAQQGIAEINGYQQRVADLIATYEERCVKNNDDATAPPVNAIPGFNPSAPTEDDINAALERIKRDIDDCDLASLTQAYGQLMQLITGIQQLQLDLYLQLQDAGKEPNAALDQLESSIPGKPSAGFAAYKLASGAVGGIPFGKGYKALETALALHDSGLQAYDLAQGAGDVANRDAALRRVEQANERLRNLLDDNTALEDLLHRAQVTLNDVTKLIETYEERCLKDEPEDQVAVGTEPQLVIPLATDGTEWCQYGIGPIYFVPLETPGGTTVTPPENDTGTTPENGPNGGPTTTTGTPTNGGGTTPPNSTPQPNGGPRVPTDCKYVNPNDCPGTPTNGVPIPIGGTRVPNDCKYVNPDDCPDENEDGEDPNDVGEEPTMTNLTVKAKLGLGVHSTGSELAGQSAKLFADSQVNQDLPITGNNKNDRDFKEDPLQCTTGKNGECNIQFPNFSGLDGNFVVQIDATDFDGKNILIDKNDQQNVINGLQSAIGEDNANDVTITTQPGPNNNQVYISVIYPSGLANAIQGFINNNRNVIFSEENVCRDKQPASIRQTVGLFDGMPTQSIVLFGER